MASVAGSKGGIDNNLKKRLIKKRKKHDKPSGLSIEQEPRKKNMSKQDNANA